MMHFIRHILFLLALVYTLGAQASIAFRAASSAIASASAGTTVTLRGVGAIASFRSSGTISLPASTAQGDFLLLLLATKSSGSGTPTVSAPSGWTAIGTNSSPSAGLFWKIAGASEGSVSVSTPANEDAYGRIVGFYNVNTSTPFDTPYWGASASNDNCQANAVSSTDGTGSMDVLTGHGFDGYNNSPATPTGYTKQFGGASSNAWLAFFNKAVTTTGSQAAISAFNMGDTKSLKCYSGRLIIRPSTPGGGSPTLVINKPTGTTTNDVLIASIAVANSATSITAPAGWSLIRSTTQTNGVTMKLNTYYLRAGASEPNSYTWTLGSSGYAYAVGGISSFSGVESSGSPIDLENGQITASAQTHATPSITPTEDVSMLVSTHAYLSADTWNSVTNGFTEAVDIKSPASANATGIALAQNYLLQSAKAAISATGTANANPDVGATHILALKPGLDHIQLEHTSAAGLTCKPNTLTIKACLNSACTSYYTRGVTGTLTNTGSPTVNWSGNTGFTITAGQSSTTKDLQITTVGTTTLGVAATPSPAPSGTTTCNFASCNFTSADAGFLFDIPHHIAGTNQTININAVKKADNSLACTTGLQGNKSVTFKCAYSNPTSGTQAVTIGGTAMNASNNAGAACDAGGRSVSLAFDASGVANTTFNYADVGNMQVTASYTGSSGTETGLIMTGSDSFIAAPKSFSFSSTTAGPIKAGANFSTVVTALNNNSVATPNFGKESTPESVTLSATKYQPTGSSSRTGTLTSSFGAYTGGTSTATLTYNEVGTIDLTANLSSGNYLGSGQTAATGSTSNGAVGRFTPDHFDISLTHGCNSGNFTYSGQAASLQITAKNKAGTTTQNYDGTANTTPNFAKAVTLNDANSITGGSLSGHLLALTVFNAGVASASPVFTFTRGTPDKAPADLKLRATDSDSVSSSGGTSEPTTNIRIGRIRLSNAYGSERLSLKLPVQVQYWNGSYWIPNGNDSCTSIPATALAFSNHQDYKGASATWTTTASGSAAISSGTGFFTLAAPSGSSPVGSADIALNLGSGTTDTACLSAHPNTTGANLAYLRGNNGACANANSYNADPSAKVSFGVYSGESKKAVHTRELY